MRTRFNFSDPAVFKKLERQSYDGTLDVSGFPPAEYMYFSELRKIYYDFKFNGLSIGDASDRKNILLRRYRDSVYEIRQCSLVYKRYQDNLRAAEMNMSKIEKSSDPVQIALCACEALGAVTGDDSFFVRQCKKLKEDLK